MIWFVLIFAFLIIEALSFNLITIWFAFGSLCAFISTYFTDNLIIQIVVFTFFTIISLIFTKPLLDKFINKNVTKTNIDMIIGKIGIVTKEINELSPGRVKVSGKEWMAISNSHIDEGKKVRVLKIEGAKIIVREEER